MDTENAHSEHSCSIKCLTCLFDHAIAAIINNRKWLLGLGSVLCAVLSCCYFRHLDWYSVSMSGWAVQKSIRMKVCIVLCCCITGSDVWIEITMAKMTDYYLPTECYEWTWTFPFHFISRHQEWWWMGEFSSSINRKWWLLLVELSASIEFRFEFSTHFHMQFRLKEGKTQIKYCSRSKYISPWIAMIQSLAVGMFNMLHQKTSLDWLYITTEMTLTFE